MGLRLYLCTLTFCVASAFAQTELGETPIKPVKRQQVANDKYPTTILHGQVIDQATKLPLAGIQLQTLGNKNYTAMTKEDGTFTIKVPVFTTSLYVHSPQYLSQQVAVNAADADKDIRIVMLADKFAKMYDEGTTITACKSLDVSARAQTTIDNEIAMGLSADVRSVLRSADPAGGAAMFIRGYNSLTSNAQPLIVVDGVELDMQRNRTSLHLGQFNNILANLSPDDIAKVTVLKNATALYGARGANGVILIDTKRGHSMATRIDANISAGVSLVPQLPTMMNATQYRNYATEMLGTINELQKRISLGRPIDFHFLDDNPRGYYYHMYHNDTDWTDYTYRNALTQNYNINVQGGDDIGMYNLSVGYMKAESTAEKNDFSRMNVRFNTDISILQQLKTKFDIAIARTNNSVFDDGIAADLSSGAITSPGFLSLIKSPLITPYQYNSIIGGFSNLLSNYDDLYSQLGTSYSLANPVAILENASGDNKNRAENTYLSVRLEPTLTLGRYWSLTERLSYTLNRNSQRYQRPYNGVPPFEIEDLGTVTSMAASLFAKEINFLTDTRAEWNRQYGRHTLHAVAGFRYNYFCFDGSDLRTEYTTATNDKNPALTARSGYAGVSGPNDVWKNIQWYGQADYNYMNRYLATVSLLGEGNSRFGQEVDGLSLFGVKWAMFPSVQLGWVLTNEKWFPKSGAVDYLRINAGFDMSGNDDISNYAARSAFTSVRFNNNAIGMQLTNIGNDKIKWETSSKVNLGLQGYFFNNRLAFNADFFMSKTRDLLTLKTFDNPIGGINNYWTNGGALKNTGFELGLSGKPITGKRWMMEIGATMAHYKNKVIQLPNGNYTTSVYGDNNILTAVGHPVGLFYGYKTAGVLTTDAEAKSAGLNGSNYLYMVDAAGNRKNFTAGDMHFVDFNKDGMISEADKTIIGDPNPDVYGNIFAKVSYNRLTLDLGLTYSLGGDVYNYQRSVLNSGSTLYNQQVAETGRWRYEGQQAELPKLAYGDPLGNNRFSDRWIEDGSYLRLKTVTLTYQVPIPTTWSWLQGLSVWAEARNLATWTKYLGSDPEFSVGNSVLCQGIDAGLLAQGRSFLFGVKINL